MCWKNQVVWEDEVKLQILIAQSYIPSSDNGDRNDNIHLLYQL